MFNFSYDDIAKMIDHSLLKPTLTDNDIDEGCRIAAQYNVATVCVRPSDVVRAKKNLAGTSVLTTTVIGFPHGTTTTNAKLEEAKEAIKNGATELDVVINIGKHRSGDYRYVRDDLKAVIDYAHSKKVLVKVIFENCYLNDGQKIKACEICNDVDADFVKTSTGYGSGGAEDNDLILMRKHAKPSIQVKAAGGVRTLARAIRVRELGCARFGCTATVAILEELKGNKPQAAFGSGY
jgi:deoxyribose-phosphate aldolase